MKNYILKVKDVIFIKQYVLELIIMKINEKGKRRNEVI